MTAWVVIPAKPPAAAKGRLAGALPAEDRSRLAAAMLQLAVDAACEAAGADQVAIVGTSPIAPSRRIRVIAEPHGGLNAALDHARTLLCREGATRMVSLAADLPQVTAEDVRALLALAEGIAGIAPDRHGSGTNAISLPLPSGLGFAYHYGVGSCELHLAEAARIGLPIQRIERPGLARDVDEPADLDDARQLLLRQHG